MILDGISLASIMPGPLAVNVVTYIGYFLKGIRGALISMIAVILPSFLLVLVLSVVYFEYGDLSITSKFFEGVMPGVIAIIISVAINMAKKSIHDTRQIFLCVLSGGALFLVGGFLLTVLIIVFGGLVGWIFYYKKESHKLNTPFSIKGGKTGFSVWFFAGVGVIILLIIILPYVSIWHMPENFLVLRKLSLIFGGMSLSLFGGGYVFIPAIQEIIVDQLQWLTIKEFSDGIAMGQITPGPILISAAFIGYKIAGFFGALVATIAIFMPSGLLMIMASYFLEYFKKSDLLKAIFMGVRPAVIGMIFSAALNLGLNLSLNWQTLFLFLLILLLNIRFRINATFLIPLSGILGLVIY